MRLFMFGLWGVKGSIRDTDLVASEIFLPCSSSWLQPAASLLLIHQGARDQPCKAKAMAMLRSTESKATYEKLLPLPRLPFRKLRAFLTYRLQENRKEVWTLSMG